MNLKFYIFGAAAICFYALLPAIVRKVSLGDFPPFAFIAITMSILMVCATAASLLFEKDFSFAAFQPTTYFWLGCFALLNFIAFACYIVAMKGVPVAHYQLLGMMGPIIGSIFAWFILKENPDARAFLGFGIMCAGFLVAISKKLGWG